MKTLFVTAALAAAIVPTVATAQALPATVIGIVDLDRVTRDCTACKAATATLQGRATALQNRERALVAPLETEGKALRKSSGRGRSFSGTRSTLPSRSRPSSPRFTAK